MQRLGVNSFLNPFNKFWCYDLPEAKDAIEEREIAVWVLFRLFIDSNERCNTVNAP